MATRILFVDDNQDTLLYVQFMLQRRGYEVAIASSAQEALQIAGVHPPDLFLVDVLMPDVDGFTLTESIRADPGMGHLPIILFSAATTARHKARGYEAGADDYLTKPILNDELDGRIQAALKLTELRRKAAEPAQVEPAAEEEPAEGYQGRVIGFWGCKGGVGATTLVVNSAIALSQDSQVIVSDLNLGMGSMVLQLGLQVSTTPRSPWTMAPEEITSHMVQEALIPYSDSLHLLLMSEGEHWSPTVPFVDTVLNQLRPLADYILLDMGAGVTADKFPLLLSCNQVVLVSGADRIASVLAEYALESAVNLNIPRDRISVVMIQRRDTTGMLTPELLERHLRLKLDAVIPIAQEDALMAFEQGRPAISALPQSQLAKSYTRFAQRLATRK